MNSTRPRRSRLAQDRVPRQPGNSKYTGSYPTERKDAEEKIHRPLEYARKKAIETREAWAKSRLRKKSA